MIQTIIILASLLCGIGGLAVAAWSMREARKQVAALAAQQCSVQVSDAQPGVAIDLAAVLKLTADDVARAFRVPAHLIRGIESRPEPDYKQTRETLCRWGFEAMMRQRTEQAHREFMRRTSCLPAGRDLRPTPEQVDQYHGISIGFID